MQRVVGKIIGFHGLQGEIKVYPLVDEWQTFKYFKQITALDTVFDVTSVRSHKDLVLITLNGIDDLTSAENLFQYTKQTILIEAELEEVLEDGEYYLDDLAGMKVIDKDSARAIAEVIDCSDNGQISLLIKLSNGKSLQVPFVKEYVSDVDVATRTVSMTLADDFLELAQ